MANIIVFKNDDVSFDLYENKMVITTAKGTRKIDKNKIVDIDISNNDRIIIKLNDNHKRKILPQKED